MRYTVKMGWMAVWAVLSAGWLTGCAGQSVNSVEEAEMRGTPAVVVDKRVQTDASLGRKLGVIEVREATVSDDLRKVQVELINKTRKTLSFNYRFDWYNVDGMAVESPLSIWKSKQVEGGERFSIASVAPSARAVDFRVKLLESKQQ